MWQQQSACKAAGEQRGVKLIAGAGVVSPAHGGSVAGRGAAKNDVQLEVKYVRKDHGGACLGKEEGTSPWTKFKRWYYFISQ
jgi:hypothetical protein